jgi:hypothetical protein
MLAYGSPVDQLDEVLKIAASTALECLGKFAKGVIGCFGPEYLCPPTTEELEKILLDNEARGFRDMHEVLIVCIGPGIIALKVGLVSFLVVTKKFLL